MKKITVKKISLLLFVMGVAATAQAKNLGVMGETFPVGEQDIRLRMAADAAKVNWTKINNGIVEDAKTFVNKQQQWNVTPASVDTIKIVDISQELTRDMMGYEAKPDGTFKEVVIFKKGYRFNPLERMSLYKWFAVFNGESKEQIEWIKELEGQHPGRFVFMAVDGKLSELAEIKGMAIYPTNPWLFATAGVQHTPAIVGVSASQKSKLTVAEFVQPYSIEKVNEAMK